MQFIQRLVKRGERFKGPVQEAAIIHRQAQAVKDAIKIRIQPVADHLYMETDQEQFHIERDFPALAPPWPKALYVWTNPRFFRSEGRIIPNPFGTERVECICLAASGPYPKPPAKWVINFLLWTWHPNFPDRIALIAIVIGINEEGQVCDLEPGHHASDEFLYQSGGTDHWPDERMHPISKEIGQGSLHTLLYPALLATCLYNHKNLRVVRVPTAEQNRTADTKIFRLLKKDFTYVAGCSKSRASDSGRREDAFFTDVLAALGVVARGG